MLPADTLEGRVAVITGGSSGLGLAMAEYFGRLGASIVITGRNEERLAAAAATLEKNEGRGSDVLTVPMDVRDPAQVNTTLSAALDRYGRVDILVNNAAGNFAVPAEDLSVNGWNAVVNIVLNGTFYCSRAFGKHWIDIKQPGTILNVIATYAWTGGPGTVHSASAKAGVLAMTRTLAVEWAPHRIRVNAIAPGPIDKTGGARALWPTKTVEQQVRASVPLGRLGEPDEVARAAAFLVSDHAGFINGECLVIDGGAWLGRNVFTERTPR